MIDRYECIKCGVPLDTPSALCPNCDEGITGNEVVLGGPLGDGRSFLQLTNIEKLQLDTLQKAQRSLETARQNAALREAEYIISRHANCRCFVTPITEDDLEHEEIRHRHELFSLDVPTLTWSLGAISDEFVRRLLDAFKISEDFFKDDN